MAEGRAPPGRVGAPSSGRYGATDCAWCACAACVAQIVVHGGPWHTSSDVAGIEAWARRGAPSRAPHHAAAAPSSSWPAATSRRWPLAPTGAAPGERVAPECPAAPFSGPLRPLAAMARRYGPWPLSPWRAGYPPERAPGVGACPIGCLPWPKPGRGWSARLGAAIAEPLALAAGCGGAGALAASDCPCPVVRGAQLPEPLALAVGEPLEPPRRGSGPSRPWSRRHVPTSARAHVEL